MNIRPIGRQYIKVFYTPMEAAIRWSDLFKQEQQILDQTGHQLRPTFAALSPWPTLYRNIERLFDGMGHGELSFGTAGVTHNDPALLAAPDLTIRHVDFKRWLVLMYPAEQPAFLFDEQEKLRLCAMTSETIRGGLSQDPCSRMLCFHRANAQVGGPHPLADPAETTNLNIIGGLLTLLLGQTPRGFRYSAFTTLDSVINALVVHHRGRAGIDERTLRAKFAQAKRQLCTRP